MFGAYNRPNGCVYPLTLLCNGYSKLLWHDTPASCNFSFKKLHLILLGQEPETVVLAISKCLTYCTMKVHFMKNNTGQPEPVVLDILRCLNYILHRESTFLCIRKTEQPEPLVSISKCLTYIVQGSTFSCIRNFNVAWSRSFSYFKMVYSFTRIVRYHADEKTIQPEETRSFSISKCLTSCTGKYILMHTKF